MFLRVIAFLFAKSDCLCTKVVLLVSGAAVVADVLLVALMLLESLPAPIVVVLFLAGNNLVEVCAVVVLLVIGFISCCCWKVTLLFDEIAISLVVVEALFGFDGANCSFVNPSLLLLLLRKSWCITGLVASLFTAFSIFVFLVGGCCCIGPTLLSIGGFICLFSSIVLLTLVDDDKEDAFCLLLSSLNNLDNEFFPFDFNIVAVGISSSSLFKT